MKELKKRQNVKLFSRQADVIDGVVFDFDAESVVIAVHPKHLQLAKKIKELDEFLVDVETVLGTITMKSDVISALDSHGLIEIENTPALVNDFVQKREFVRINADFVFHTVKFFKKSFARCVNISCGGICFLSHEKFSINEKINIEFIAPPFDYNFNVEAKIFRIMDDKYIAQFNGLSKRTESQITKFIFKKISEK